MPELICDILEPFQLSMSNALPLPENDGFILSNWAALINSRQDAHKFDWFVAFDLQKFFLPYYKQYQYQETMERHVSSKPSYLSIKVGCDFKKLAFFSKIGIPTLKDRSDVCFSFLFIIKEIRSEDARFITDANLDQCWNNFRRFLRLFNKSQSQRQIRLLFGGVYKNAAGQFAIEVPIVKYRQR